MQVITSIEDVRRWRRQFPGSVGFVPTMGYLHQGHLELARCSRAENKHTAASIFVNPTQFGPSEDFRSYPRDLDRDLELLKGVGTDMVFAPLSEGMYPAGFNTWVEVKGVTEKLEGASRPGHFQGVATVVAKLFNIVEPTRAYFGQKDAQQVVVIQKMVADLNMNLEVVVVPTVREPDGLAMSSRNTYLNSQERQAAPVLWQALTLAKKMWEQGERDAQDLRQEMMALIQKEPLARIDYVSVADSETLDELKRVDRRALVSMAVRMGKTRLIDCIVLGE